MSEDLKNWYFLSQYQPTNQPTCTTGLSVKTNQLSFELIEPHGRYFWNFYELKLNNGLEIFPCGSLTVGQSIKTILIMPIKYTKYGWYSLVVSTC